MTDDCMNVDQLTGVLSCLHLALGLLALGGAIVVVEVSQVITK